MRTKKHLIVLAVVASALAAALAHAGPKTKARLAKGEILVSSKRVAGSSSPRVKAMAVAESPADKLWAIIDKCDDYERTMVRIAEAKELSRKGAKVRCRVTVEMPFPLSNLTAVTEAVHTVKPGEMYKREWKLIEGDYKSNVGSWTLVPFNKEGTRTLIVYEVHADPNIPIPAGIKKAAQKTSIPKLMKKLRSSVK